MKRNTDFITLFFIGLLCFDLFKAQEKNIYDNVLNNSTNWIVEQQPKGKVEVVNSKMDILDLEQ